MKNCLYGTLYNYVPGSTRCRSTLQVLYTNSTKEQFISFISKNNQYYKKIHLTTINLKIRSKKYTMSHNTPLSKGSSDTTQLHDMLLQKKMIEAEPHLIGRMFPGVANGGFNGK